MVDERGRDHRIGPTRKQIRGLIDPTQDAAIGCAIFICLAVACILFFHIGKYEGRVECLAGTLADPTQYTSTADHVSPGSE